MKKIIDGISVETNGKETNQSIVFIHGFPFDHTLWDDVINKLKDDYYCISFDVRGFGKSEVDSGQYTMESYTEDLENIISKLNLDKPILCGFSMGGYIALRSNEKFQGNYKALILANTATNSDNDEAKLKRSSAISSIDSDGVEVFLENFFSAAFSEEFNKKETKKLEELKNKILGFSPVGIKGALLAMVSRTDTTESLNDIDIPVLLITADNDKIIPPETMKKMGDKIKNSTFVSLKNSGHVSMIENTEEFNNAIRNFFKLSKKGEKMPYENVDELPKQVTENLPKHAQDIYKEAYNSAWDEYKDPKDRQGDASREEVSHRVAWAAVKNKYEKNDNGKWVKK